MATTFLEPGGDATFNVLDVQHGGFWGGIQGTPVIATDFVHGGHKKSIKYPTGGFHYVHSRVGNLADAGSRVSFWIYFNALPGGNNNIMTFDTSGGTGIVFLRLTSAGVLQLFSSAQIGSNGPTLATGQGYRISIAYTITSTTVNRFELFVNGVSGISVTNGTLSGTGTSILTIGNVGSDGSSDMRSSDHYIDNSSSLTDPGNIWVTAKRPNANGTTNGFTTQIGSGGSGYGTGHSPQINERALSNTNGWSMIGAGSAITEEYNIEGKSVGDIDISTATIVDYLGWVDAKALLSETGQIIVNNVTNNISLTSTETIFTQIAGSSTYPAGTGTDIGIVTSTTVTTVSLYECGIVVAYIPAVVTTTSTTITTSTTTTTTSSSTSSSSSSSTTTTSSSTTTTTSTSSSTTTTSSSTTSTVSTSSSTTTTSSSTTSTLTTSSSTTTTSSSTTSTLSTSSTISTTTSSSTTTTSSSSTSSVSTSTSLTGTTTSTTITTSSSTSTSLTTTLSTSSSISTSSSSTTTSSSTTSTLSHSTSSSSTTSISLSHSTTLTSFQGLTRTKSVNFSKTTRGRYPQNG